MTAHTKDAISLCEAAGFDVILVESVGVGQSEADITKLVNALVLVLPPAAGDELQALKRGIFELADLVLINKTDGELKHLAEKSKHAYASSFKLMGRSTPVLNVSALESTGFQAVWKTLSHFLPLILFLVVGCFKIESNHEKEKLIQALLGKDQKEAHRALIKLTRQPDPKALDAIISYAERKDPEERIQAILAVRQLGDKRALSWLFVLSRGHPNELVRNAALEALTSLEKQDNALTSL